ncbi:MAG TPA: DMT family transporter [Alphaproteobacteria bacterium]|nr:DMT family transporter [Alphaproteobacteria bacterium]
MWGVQQVAVKVANGGISPLLQAGLRSAGAAILVFAWTWLRGVRLFERDGSLGLGLLIACLFSGEFALAYWGLDYTTASRGVLFFYTTPFFVALGAHFFIPQERLHRLKVIGLLAAFVGIAIAVADSLELPTSRELIGDGLLLGAAGLWGATIVVIKGSRLAQVSPHKVLLYQLAGSAAGLLVASPLIGEPGITDPSWLVLSCLAYQTVLVAFASYLVWFWLIARYPASTISAFAFLTPIFGMIAGAVLLGEHITSLLVAAMLLVAGGIYLVNRPPAAAPSRCARGIPRDRR